jgi:hypothetical protein
MFTVPPSHDEFCFDYELNESAEMEAKYSSQNHAISSHTYPVAPKKCAIRKRRKRVDLLSPELWGLRNDVRVANKA